MYMEVTNDGKNFTYFKLIRRWDDTFDLKIDMVRPIINARSIANVLKLQPTVDEITLTILLEKTTLSTSEREWMKTPGFGRVTNLVNSFAIVETEATFYNFLTCAGKSSLNLLIYFEPFDTSVWVTLAVLTILTSFSFWVISEILFPMKRFSFIKLKLTLVALLLNTSVYFQEIFKHKRLRGLLSVWFLTSIVLNTAYRTESFAKTIAPTEIRRPEKFSQLRNFKLLATNICEPRNSSVKRLSCTQFSKDIATSLLTSLFGDAVPIGVYFRAMEELYVVKYGRDELINRTFSVSILNGKLIVQIFRQIRPLKIENNLTVFNILRNNCQKLVYVAQNDEIQKLALYSNSPCNSTNQRLYSGKETFLKKSGTWYIQQSGGNYLIRRMRYLEYSGIYGFWKRWINTHKIHPSCSDLKGISLNFNILILFYVVLVCFIICIMVFTGELYWKSMWTALGRVYRSKSIMAVYTTGVNLLSGRRPTELQ
ncbi:unnamed protein product [Orchesella dallaii]|uniref:Uncharacterized protein n=1 Tax=Orchesella dallaii TaxID=48710 RepID=A0ABP1S8V5_9HEXA